MKGMTIIVKTIGSWVKVLIFLFGIYIVLFGHLTPGGGFVFNSIHNVQAAVPVENLLALYQTFIENRDCY